MRFGVCTFGSPKYVAGSPVDVPRREECIEKALANKLEQRSAAREAQRKAAQKEIEEFTGEFLNARPPASESFVHVGRSALSPVATVTRNRRRRSQAAREVFQMIDDDESGTLEKPEIVEAIQG